MKVVSYVVKTPFSEIYADVKEFFELRQRERFLESEYRYLLKSLKVSGRNTFGCIRPTGVKQSGGEQVKYCENFFDKECDLECPSVCKHNRYWQLNEERKQAITKRAEFWDKKLQNLK